MQSTFFSRGIILSNENFCKEYDEDVKEKSTDELSQLVDEEKEEYRDVLDDIPQPYKQTLGDKRSKFIDTYCQDKELNQFFVRKSIEKIWKDIFWNADKERSIVKDIGDSYNDDKSLFRRNTRKAFLENLHNKEGGEDSYNINIVMGIIRL